MLEHAVTQAQWYRASCAGMCLGGRDTVSLTQVMDGHSINCVAPDKHWVGGVLQCLQGLVGSPAAPPGSASRDQGRKQ